MFVVCDQNILFSFFVSVSLSFLCQFLELVVHGGYGLSNVSSYVFSKSLVVCGSKYRNIGDSGMIFMTYVEFLTAGHSNFVLVSTLPACLKFGSRCFPPLYMS